MWSAGVAVAILLVLWFALGLIVRSSVNAAGPAILGVPVSLSNVAVKPLRGRVELGGLQIGNPPGFKSERLFELEHLSLHAPLTALLRDPATVEEIVIRGVQVTYETSGRRSNLGALMEGLSRGRTSAPPAATTPPAAASKGRGVVIRHVVLEDIRLKFAATFTAGQGIVLPLDRIELTNLGGEQNPLTIASAIAEVLTALASGVGRGVAASAGDLARQGLDVAGTLGELGFKELSTAAEEQVRNARALGEKAAAGVQTVTEGAGRLLRGLRGVSEGGQPPADRAP